MSISSVVTSGGDDIIAAIGLITPIVEGFQHCLIVIEVNKLTCRIFTLVFFYQAIMKYQLQLHQREGLWYSMFVPVPLSHGNVEIFLCVDDKILKQKKLTKNTYNNNIHKCNYWCVWKLDTK